MKHKLIIKLLNYFLLIAIAAIMIGVEFFFEMQRDNLKNEICNTPNQTVISSTLQPLDNNIPTALTQLRNKIVIMFGVLTLVVAIVMTMFIKNITLPLQKMADVAKSINEGDLSQVIEIGSHDEIGMVGQAINELTSNLQESASFTCITAMQTLNKVNTLDAKLKDNIDISSDDIKEIQFNLNSLIEFADSFQLLHTEIDDNA